MRRFVSAFLLSMALAAPALADTATPAPAPEPGKTAKKEVDIVCTHETPTGTRFAVKVCTTAEQRKAQRREAEHAQDRMQGNSAPVIPN
jgi:hypothetical protein